MKILITGAFGFVGTNLSTSLQSEHHRIALDIKESEHHCFDEYFSWNDMDNIAWQSVDAIIHLAGKAHDTKNTTDEKSYFEINTGLTKIIFDHFLKSKAKKFIFFSSVKAVADTVENNELTEETKPNPQTPYGKSKLEAEKYIVDELKKWKDTSASLSVTAEKKQVYILRPSMIHGPGNKGNLNLLYKIVGKGIPWPLGAFKNSRSFTSMANLSFVIDEVIEKNIKSGVYNISDDATLSTNKIIGLIAESQNKKERIWNFPVSCIRISAKTGDLLHLPLNSERLKKLTESYIVSNNKLKTALNIKQMPISAIEGMQKTLASFK